MAVIELVVALALVAVGAPVAPRLVALILAVAGLWAVRLHPRKTIDSGWGDLLFALKCSLFTRARRDRAKLELGIREQWATKEEAVVLLSVRTGFDLLLGALDLPKGSEVLFVPGISIPGMVKIVESHGLRPVGLDPPSHEQILPPKLAPYVTTETRMVVLTNLFGCVHDMDSMVLEAKELGLFVVQDCAQAFIGSLPAGQRAAGAKSAYPTGFRGLEGADASFVSFGTMKTLTALGGAVGRVKDPEIRKRMLSKEATYPVRPLRQYFQSAVKGLVIKLIGLPCLWGLVEALFAAVGVSFDELIVSSVRGFPNEADIRQRPSIPLLQLLQRRLRRQHEASFEDAPGSSATSSVFQRRRNGNLIAEELAKGGVRVVAKGADNQTWWLLPVLDDDPKRLVAGLVSRGFDATCSSTQLKRVASVAAGGPQSAVRPSPGVDFMGRVVYLPLTPEMSRSDAEALAAAVLDVRNSKASPRPFAKTRPGTGVALCLLILALVTFLRPTFVLSCLPSQWSLVRLAMAGCAATAILVLAARRFAATPDLQIDPKLLKAMSQAPRAEGVAYCRGKQLAGGRIDGAVLITGSTGFVGGGILFSLLARAKELGVTRVVLLIRRRGGKAVEARLKELRASPIFDEVRDIFDQLVVGLEGDVAERDFGWGDSNRGWPYQDQLKSVLHCAGDVRFDQPLQQAALSLISATLQMQQLASRWGAKRFLFISTAFVHGVPSATTFLEERLVELRDFDPMELYRDAVSHGKWAETCMHDLGFPNTYTFAKAVAEHLVLRACESDGIDARIVRPSIVGPAWAAPWAGWAGDKPSTIVGGAELLARRGLKVFKSSKHPCPLVPVDMVADVALGALAGAAGSGCGRILHAALDSSEASKMPSFKVLIGHLYQVLALTGNLSLPELGLMCNLLRWCEDDTVFWMLHPIVNVLPSKLLAIGCWVGGRLLGLFGSGMSSEVTAAASLLGRCSNLPVLYQPFTSPASAWLFRSSLLRLPEDWDATQYSLLVHRAAVAFARRPAVPSQKGPPRGYAEEFRNVKVVPGPWVVDAFLAFSQPKSRLLHCVASFLIRRALSWMHLTVVIDIASLESVTDLQAPLVLCPNHRSLLDFVLIGVTCFQLQPLLPALQIPKVAADAEFASLPFLGRALAALGAFFVRRGGGSVQPDPALRAKVGGAFHGGRPLEVFLEGLRSRGRRQMRLRTGLLRALRDVSQRTVAIVPLALSYELLPEDASFYDEMSGLPRPPLRTGALLHWAFRGMRGELPPLGEARLRLGVPRTLDASADLGQVVAGVQQQLVELTSLTTLHARALAELLELPPDAVTAALRNGGLMVRDSSLSATAPLPEHERWPLALQAATLTPLRKKLPPQWAFWLVEQAPTPPTEDAATPWSEQKLGGAEAVLDLAAVASAFAAQMLAAEAAAEAAVQVLRDSGIAKVTEEHLLQELLLPGCKDCGCLPPPLARGAASIVAARHAPATLIGCGLPDVTSGGGSGSRKKPQSVAPLWPSASPSSQKRDDGEALERWGFKDTRFVADWVDGKPAVQITSRRYPGLGAQPLFQLWSFFQTQLGVPMSVRDMLPERPPPELPPLPDGLEEALAAALPPGRARTDPESRLRAGTGHGLADIWKLRTRQLPRLPDAVVRPENEDEVQALLAAAAKFGFAVIPVGGRTNVTSATAVPPKEVDPRPFVMLDMRGMAKIVWVNAEDGVAMIEAGITGMALKEGLSKFGVNMGMEPDSMEFSTLGGWIATRASGMKRARYGNIEDMVLEVRVVTPTGMLWQRHGDSSSASGAATAIGRASTNLGLPGLVLGSEGCLGVVTSAVVRITSLPEVVEYQSVVFPDWACGASWMREVARLPAALRPASCRLMDQNQLRLSRALREGGGNHGSSLSAALQSAYLRFKGVRLDEAAAATLVFEGSRAEVRIQKEELSKLVSRAGGVWGGAASGEAGYALTFAIAYLRDFGMDYRILSESLETMAPWSCIRTVWPAVEAAVQAEHRALRLPGKPFMSCRMTQLYDEGAVLYMYIAVCTAGLAPERALEAFGCLEHAARNAAMSAGGCLSHHHGVGKLRSSLLPNAQSPALMQAVHGLKTSVDPDNVLGARNGAWAQYPQEAAMQGCVETMDRDGLDLAMH